MVKATEGVEVQDSPIKFVPISSKRFLCARCLDRLIEMTPVIKKGQIKQVQEINKKLKASGGLPIMRIKIKCGRGCHDKPGFAMLPIQPDGKSQFGVRAIKPDPRAQAQKL